jgi:hypothetical protein
VSEVEGVLLLPSSGQSEPKEEPPEALHEEEDEGRSSPPRLRVGELAPMQPRPLVSLEGRGGGHVPRLRWSLSEPSPPPSVHETTSKEKKERRRRSAVSVRSAVAVRRVGSLKMRRGSRVWTETGTSFLLRVYERGLEGREEGSGSDGGF